MPTNRIEWVNLDPSLTENRVYRSLGSFTASTPPAVLATVGASDVLYDDVTAVDGVDYYYAVGAFNGIDESITLATPFPTGSGGGGGPLAAPTNIRFTVTPE